MLIAWNFVKQSYGQFSLIAQDTQPYDIMGDLHLSTSLFAIFQADSWPCYSMLVQLQLSAEIWRFRANVLQCHEQGLRERVRVHFEMLSVAIASDCRIRHPGSPRGVNRSHYNDLHLL
jgi:hypothetical protein